MVEDQYTQQDPRDQYPRPEEQRGQEQRHPGTGDAMRPEPDYGESTTAAALGCWIARR
jgi:hypothetical protein